MAVQMPEIVLTPLLPEILISIVALVVLLIEAWMGRAGRGLASMLTLAGLVGAALLIHLNASETRLEVLSGQVVTDAFSAYMKLLMMVAALFTLLMSGDYLKRHDMMGGEYLVLMLFATMGAMIMASSADFTALYLGLELMSLSIYVLAAYKRDDVSSNEAGLKYYILGAMGSGFLLYGISLIYGMTGATHFATIREVLAHQTHVGLATTLGMILVISGIAFKLAAVPFHMWAPDVYEGAPTSVVSFLAVLPKLGAFAGLYRVLFEAMLPLQAQWSPVVQLIAAASVAVGGVAAIAQTNIKRMLAYSSIGHMGYALIGLAAGNTLGHQAVILYLSIYIFMNLGTFALILAMNGGETSGEMIEDYKGLAHRRPVLAFIMMVFMFSMAGVPPLAGFIGKFYVFWAAVQAGLTGLAIWGVLFSAVSAFYYIRIVKFMYFDEPKSDFTLAIPRANSVVFAVAGALVLLWGIFPASIIALAEFSVKSFQ